MSSNSSLVSEGWLDSLAAIQYSPLNTVLCGALLVAIAFSLYNGKRKDVTELGGFSVVNAWEFFARRFDFLKGNFEKFSGNIFRFRVLHHTVAALRGEGARKAFFDDKSLNFTEGYRILMGSSPDLSDISDDLKSEKNVTEFNKRLALLLNRNRLSDVLPVLMEDMNKRMLGWGKEGRFDPFRNIYDLVFQMTVRMASCDELATNYDDMRLLQKYYWDLEKSATPTALLLPWIPSPAKKKKKLATKGLYTTLKKYVDKRQNAEVPSSDAIDVLLAKGDVEHEIIGFVLSVIFAGVINTGMNACWALMYLACNPEWRGKAKAEIDQLIVKHTDPTSTEPLYKRLSCIPVSVWEDEMPVVDTVIRETIRITLNTTMLRRNVNNDFDINGDRITKGEFLAYNVFDAHMNPEIYSNPEKFDPDRYSPGREEDKKSTFAFLGWGVGRHPCTGMKVAKLEIKAILALFLAGYDYSIVDTSGNYPKSLPKPDYNDIHSARPIGEQCFFRFNRKLD